MLMSCGAAALGKYYAHEDVVIEVPVDTRDTFSSDMISMFVNMVPVRSHRD